MGERKIKVPEGMLRAALYAITRGAQSEIYTKPEDAAFRALNGALVWLSEHPIVPTQEQAEEMLKGTIPPYSRPFGPSDPTARRPDLFFCCQDVIYACTRWQRQMFYGEEEELPGEIRLLLSKSDEEIDARILEAYYLGRNSALRKEG